MKKKKTSRLFKIACLFVAIISLSSCTKSFCTPRDKASYLWSIDQVEEGAKSFTDTVNEMATNSSYLLPSEEFINAWNVKIDKYAYLLIEADPKLTIDDLDYARAIAKYAGNGSATMEVSDWSTLDFSKDTMWANYDVWMKELVFEVGVDKSPDQNYINFYKNQMNSKVAAMTTCISPVDTTIDNHEIEGKSWKEAFNYGLLEGLIVYPISWLIYTFSVMFGLNGWGQLLSILVVTIIVRAFLILCTFKPTLSQHKMQMLQPEIAKIQAKYPNAATNPYEKQKMGQEQLALYKKNKINPASMFIVMLFQFPIFICVWSAMTGASVLADGEIFGVALSINTGSALGSWKWVAWVIFVLMAVAQFMAMKVPQLMQKKKDVAKLSKNPTEEKNAKTMKMVSYGMTIMIIFMGINLPLAMTFYWLVTALISMAQSVITQLIMKKTKNKKEVKYKTKKAK